MEKKINKKPGIIVFDGHDGSGKTTVSKEIAAQLGAKYVKPFDQNLGEFVYWLYLKKQFKVLDEVARLAIDKIIEENEHEEVLIFDRHWMTIFTILPEKYYKNWVPLPITILCWADLDTTLKRLSGRIEKKEKDEWHAHYCKIYRELAGKYNIPLADTTHSKPSDIIKWTLNLLKKSTF